jgi:hypothetical protein
VAAFPPAPAPAPLIPLLLLVLVLLVLLPMLLVALVLVLPSMSSLARSPGVLLLLLLLLLLLPPRLIDGRRVSLSCKVVAVCGMSVTRPMEHIKHVNRSVHPSTPSITTTQQPTHLSIQPINQQNTPPHPALTGT